MAISDGRERLKQSLGDNVLRQTFARKISIHALIDISATTGISIQNTVDPINKSRLAFILPRYDVFLLYKTIVERQSLR
jgi:hypothetical protein